jgi:hypothetical protein
VGLWASGVKFRNTTQLDSNLLRAMFSEAIAGWPLDGLVVSVRYSRGADFSGTCYYKEGRIYVNLGRNNTYPYAVPVQVARAESDKHHWWRELYSVEAADAYQLVLFVFMHEFYHWLVKRARRNVRQKEARCDRFATRALVEGHGAAVRDAQGRPVPRSSWDFQDLDGFVAAARPLRRRPRRRPLADASRLPGGQLLLFDGHGGGPPALQIGSP